MFIYCAARIKHGYGVGGSAAVGIPELFESGQMDGHHSVIHSTSHSFTPRSEFCIFKVLSKLLGWQNRNVKKRKFVAFVYVCFCLLK